MKILDQELVDKYEHLHPKIASLLSLALADPEAFETDPKRKSALKLANHKFLELIEKHEKSGGAPPKPKTPKKKPTTQKKPAPKKTTAKKKPTPKKTTSHDSDNLKINNDAQKVKDISRPIYWIRRFLRHVNRDRDRGVLELYLRSLGREILNKKVHSDQPYANIVDLLQQHVLAELSKPKRENKIHITVEDATLKRLMQIAGGEKVFPSITLLRSFAYIGGKKVRESSARNLMNRIKKAEPKMRASDPLMPKIKDAKNSLQDYIDGKDEVIDIYRWNLQGLSGLLPDEPQKKKVDSDVGVINSMDLGKVGFAGLPLDGVYGYLLGKPAKNVSILISGEPGAGKSTFAIALARSLAENAGPVCYVSAEEFNSPALQNKLKRGGGGHKNLSFCDSVENIDPSAKHVFIDSAQAANLSVEDWKELRAQMPDVMFAVILQNRKDGRYKGESEWPHMTDVHVVVTRDAIATHKNRFEELRTVQNPLYN